MFPTEKPDIFFQLPCLSQEYHEDYGTWAWKWPQVKEAAGLLLSGKGLDYILVIHFFRVHQNITLPETNIAPENRPSQKETSIPTVHFQGLC